MSDFLVETNSISPIAAILWCFYPMAALVVIELIMRVFSDDDDDDTNGGKGIRIRPQELQPAYAPSPT